MEFALTSKLKGQGVGPGEALRHCRGRPRIQVDLERLRTLRAGRVSFRRIGQALGISTRTARRLWQAGIPPQNTPGKPGQKSQG